MTFSQHGHWAAEHGHCCICYVRKINKTHTVVAIDKEYIIACSYVSSDGKQQLLGWVSKEATVDQRSTVVRDGFPRYNMGLQGCLVNRPKALSWRS